MEHPVLPRRGWAQHPAHPADYVPDTDLHSFHMDVRRRAGQGFHGLLPAARNRNDRRLPGPGPVPVLHLLGVHPRADVLPDRHLGRAAAHLCRHQVLPVYNGRFHLDAASHPVARHLRRDLFGAGPDRPGQHPGWRADLAVPGFHGGLRHQGADVASALLAARRPRRSANGRLRHPGRCTAEDGYLWLPALQHSPLPAGGAAGGSVDRTLCDDRHHLRRGGLVCAGGCQEAGRLFLGQPPGICDAWPVRPEFTGRGRGDPADGQSRPEHGCLVPPGGHDL